MSERKYGWKPQMPDHRDVELKFSSHQVSALPTTNSRFADLLPQIWNQGQLGSCTAHGILRIFLACAKAEENQTPMLSRLMLYYCERSIEGTVNQDAGAVIRTGIKVLIKNGCCEESLWPYNIQKFAQSPPQKCFDNALKYNALQYKSVQPRIDQIKASLLQSRSDGKGSAVVFGMPVWESFEGNQAAQTGLIPIPGNNEQQLGGHCMAFNGFWDDQKQLIGFDNSWDSSWGDKGSGYLPYWFINNGLVSDCWVITDVEDQDQPTPPTPTPTPGNWTITIKGTGTKPSVVFS